MRPLQESHLLPPRVIQFPHLYRIAQIDAPSLRKDSQKIYLANPPVWKSAHNLRVAARVESLLFQSKAK